MTAANDSESLQLATWAPSGNALIYVYQNNIFYRLEAEVPTDYQITDSGVFGTIYNGVPDWVYEGESTFFTCQLIYLSINLSILSDNLIIITMTKNP